MKTSLVSEPAGTAMLASPLSESELRQLYETALSSGLVEKEPNPVTKVTSRFSRETEWDVAIGSLSLAVLIGGFALATNPSSPFGALGLAASAMLGAVLALAARAANGHPIGHFTRGGKLRRFDDVGSGEIIGVVTQYLSLGPLKRAQRLVDSIGTQRESLASAIHEMPVLIRTLDEEATRTEHEDLRLIILSRRDAAQKCLTQLTDLDKRLVEQASEAEAAVAPVREVVEKFGRLTRLNDSLVRIQKAHGLIEKGRESLEENRLELQLLHAVSDKAMAQLQDIESMVEATRAARRELDESTRPGRELG